jgi:hypothetical protein
MEPLREASEKVADGVHLFTPSAAYRIQRNTNTDTPLPPDEPTAQNPRDGAALDYFLPAAANAVSIEILDGQGKVVRRYSNTDKPEASEEDLQKQLIPLYWLRPFRALSTDAGMHRWVWDLHYASPTATRHEYPIAAVPHDTPRYPLGPTAVPGNYTVRLTVDGKSSTAPLVVKMDPRVKTSAAGLQKKFAMETRLAAMMTESSQALVQGGAMRDQLSKAGAQSTGPAKEAIDAFEKKLNAVLGASGGFFAPPSAEVTLTRVNGAVATLYQMVWQVDADPTVSQAEALAATEHDMQDVMARWNTLKTSELPTLNKSLRESKLPEVQVQSDIAAPEAQTDEE